MTLPLSQKDGFHSLAEPPKEEGAGSHSANSHFLHAGQVYVSTKREAVATILGSCVAVCIWDSGSGIGGVAHYLLPSWDGRGSSSARYGTVAIPALIQKLMDAGARRDVLRAKVFGGGCLFDAMREGQRSQDHLGRRNVEIAKEMLTKERIPIVSSDVGGDRGKRIIFNTHNGESVVKEL